eukprot:8167184-Alexandrium_andersonii.AAC.1
MSLSTTSRSGSHPVNVKSPPMNDAPHIQLRIVKATCAGLASGAPEALEDLRVERFPTGRGGT